MGMHIVICKVSGNKREDKKLQSEYYQAYPEFDLL